MPLPLTFGKSPVGTKKYLDSIREEEEDSDSTLYSASPKTKPTDYVARPKPSNSNNYLSKIDDDLARKSGQRNNSTVDNALLVVTPSNVMRDTHVSNLSELTTSIKQIIEAQMRQQPIEDKCDVILQQILSSKDELTVLHQHMKQILYKNDGELPQPLDVLNESMRALTNELKSSNAEYRESISNLKMSAENERKALQAELSNERLISSNLRNELEKQMEIRSMEKKELEIEKDKLARQWKQLERSEALFEQRKMAASQGMEKAENTISMIRTAESRLHIEMEHLSHLSDYVREKDIKAQEQLEHVRELTNKLLEIDVSRNECFYYAEKNQQEMVESRMIIARDRVEMLKERARERERRQVGSIVNQ